MSTLTARQFGDICAGVWRDRATVLSGRGFLSEEDALMRAVYWRLCKGGAVKSKPPEDYSSFETMLTYETVIRRVLELNADPSFDGGPFLHELRKRYQTELRQNCQ